MNFYELILSALLAVCIVEIKWILMALIFPFQVADKKRARVKKQTGHKNIILYVLAAPYVIWERLMRGGWERYMLFQIGVIPSLHIRKWIYKCLGAQIGNKSVFHFKTEVRTPENLTVGGGYNHWR